MTETSNTLAADHAARAEELMREVEAHLQKRARKFGTDQAHQVAHATAHATLALYYQREAEH